jgi:hypothetical protein
MEVVRVLRWQRGPTLLAASAMVQRFTSTIDPDDGRKSLNNTNTEDYQEYQPNMQ